MKAIEFDFQQFDRGEKYALDLELDGAANGLSLPVLLVCGRREGKTLVTTAGVHGDEYEGVRAILDTYGALDAREIRGNFLALPVANPPAFWNGSRLSPLDGRNLARVFPGELDNGPSAAIAYFLAQIIISRADFYMDLHSSGVKLLMPTMVGYDANDSRSLAAANAFGAPVIWGHPDIEPGRTISFAKSRGIPWLYAEARGGGRIHLDDLRVYTQGLRNLMLHLGMLSGEVSPVIPRCHLYGDGNTDASLVSSKRGFLIPSVTLLQEVQAGDELGRIVNLHGETIETILAPRDGVVALVHQWPVVEPGEPTFLITGVQPTR